MSILNEVLPVQSLPNLQKLLATTVAGAWFVACSFYQGDCQMALRWVRSDLALAALAVTQRTRFNTLAQWRRTSDDGPLGRTNITRLADGQAQVTRKSAVHPRPEIKGIT